MKLSIFVFMNNIELKVSDLYELKALLEGFTFNNKIIYKGFVNEKISEGTRRMANKALRIINTELEPINKQWNEIKSNCDESVVKEKENELLSDKLSIQMEAMDFNKISELSFEHNYSFLFEKLFINY